jgi:hypothetical protein
MLGTDFRKTCEAINFLSEFALESVEGIIEVLDLVLKWSFTKLWDAGNT